MDGGWGELLAQCGPAKDLPVAGTMADVSGSPDLPLDLAAPAPPPVKHLMVNCFILLGVLTALTKQMLHSSRKISISRTGMA